MKKEDIKIVFMGTPDFACEILKSLVSEKYNVVGVFCQPDKPSGRGMKLVSPPVKVYAGSVGIPVFQPEKLRDNIEVEKIIYKLAPSMIVVAAYGKILPKYILDYPEFGCINVHGSILPKYRGAAPIQWAIINGETTTGITIMQMDEGMDTGNAIMAKECIITASDTYETLHDKLVEVGKSALIRTLEDITASGKVLSEKQKENFTVAPMLTKENTKLNFFECSSKIVNLVRGTNPVPGAWCMLNGSIIKIYEVATYEGEIKDAKNGEVISLNDKKNEIIVKCMDGLINICKLKPAGGKTMLAGDYIRGGKIKIGDMFE